MSSIMKVAAVKALKDSNLFVRGKYPIDTPRSAIDIIWSITTPNKK
jgi:hypothetical protein